MARLRDPRVLDALLALALTAGLQVHLAVTDHSGNPTVNVVGGLLLTLPLALRRRAPLGVAYAFVATVVLSAILGGGLYDGQPPPPAAILAGALTFYTVGRHVDERPAMTAAGIGIAGVWTHVIVRDQIDVQSFLFSAGLVVLTPWLLGRVNRQRALRIELLPQEALQREGVAVGEEPARIAGELHDVVAHSRAAMVAQAQGAERVLDRDPERAREALQAIERTGRNALDEMRRSLGVLRRTDADAPLAPQPGMEGLGALV